MSKAAVAVKVGQLIFESPKYHVETPHQVHCQRCDVSYRIFLHPDDHETEEQMPFRQGHVQAINYFKKAITEDHANGHTSLRFVIPHVPPVEITGDSDSIILADLKSRLRIVMTAWEAGILADRLLEYADKKTAGTDIELNQFRRLTVQGSETMVNFCFFGPTVDTQRDWICLDNDDAIEVAKQLKLIVSKKRS